MMIVVSGRERPEMSGQFDARRCPGGNTRAARHAAEGRQLAKSGRAIMRHLDGKAGSAEALGYRLALDHVGMRKCVRK